MENRRITNAELSTVITLAHLIDTINGDNGGILKTKISSDERRFLKYIVTYSRKYIIEYQKHISQESRERLKSKVHNYVPVLNPKQELQHVMLEWDDFYDLSEIIIQDKCRGCKGIEDCAIEKAFHDCFVPELDILGKEDRPCKYMFDDQDLYDTVDVAKKQNPNFIEDFNKRKEKSSRKRRKAKGSKK